MLKYNIDLFFDKAIATFFFRRFIMRNLVPQFSSVLRMFHEVIDGESFP